MLSKFKSDSFLFSGSCILSRQSANHPTARPLHDNPLIRLSVFHDKKEFEPEYNCSIKNIGNFLKIKNFLKRFNCSESISKSLRGKAPPPDTPIISIKLVQTKRNV